MSNKKSTEIRTPVGRVVSGHPMDPQLKKDNKTGLPKTMSDGITPMMESYVGLAVQKGPEKHWNQTPWGLDIWNVGTAGWPAGEYNAPDFAWKIIDGDSTVPNKKGKRPCDREGWPGHWIINCSTNFGIKCYHAGRYDPLDIIQNKLEIKRGDYARILIDAKDNSPSESPGVYLNPALFELTRAGIEIVGTGGPDAAEAFGDGPAALPANALIDTNIATAAAPAADTLYTDANGGQFTHAQLTAAGYTPAMIAALPNNAPVAAAPVAAAPVAAAPVAAAPVVPVAPALAPAAAVTPAADFLTPAATEVLYTDANGGQFTHAQLTTAGYTPTMIATLPHT